MDYNSIYLDSVRMKNFQSWKDLEIQFSHGLNVVIAPNGVGKSIIFKALKLVINPLAFTNDDRNDFLRYNSSCAEIYYTFSDNSGYSILVNDRENIYYFIKDMTNPKLEVLGSVPPQDLLDKLSVVRRGNLIGNFIDFSKDMFLVTSDEEANNNMIDLLSSSESMDKLIDIIENTKLPITKEAYKNIMYKKKTVDNILGLCNYQNIDAREQNIQLAEKLLEGSKLLVLIEKYLSGIQYTPSIDLKFKVISEDLESLDCYSTQLKSIQNPGIDLSSYSNLIETLSSSNSILESCKNVVTSKFCNLLTFINNLNDFSLELSKSEKEVKVDSELLEFLSMSDNLVSAIGKRLESAKLEDELDYMKSEIQHDGGEVYDCPIYGTIRLVDEECLPNYQ